MSKRHLPSIANALFLPLTLVLANDESPSCRAAAARCMSQVFSSATPRILDNVLRFVKQWLRDRDAKSSIQCAAAQVIGVAAESCPGALASHLRPLFLLLGNILQTTCDHAGLDDIPCNAAVRAPSAQRYGSSAILLKWDVAFHALIAVEKLLYCVPMSAQDTTLFTSNIIDLFCTGASHVASSKYGDEGSPLARIVFMATVRLLLYRNCRVRLAASRVVGQFLARITVETLSVRARQLPEKPLPYTGSSRGHGMLAELTVLLCEQLDETYLDTDIAKHVVKNLLYVIQAMHLAPQLFDVYHHENVQYCEGVGYFCKRRNPIGWLVSRLSDAARHNAPISCSIAFQCYGIVVSCTRNAKVLEPLVPLMMETVSKTLMTGVSDNNVHSASARLQQRSKHLAREIMKLLGRYVFSRKNLESVVR